MNVVMGKVEDAARERLRLWLVQHPTTQAAVARKLDWSQTSVSHFLGGRTGIDLERAARLARMLRVSLDALVGDAPADVHSDEETVLLNAFSALSEKRRRLVLDLVQEWAGASARPFGAKRRTWRSPAQADE